MDVLEQMQVKAWLSGARPEYEIAQLTNSVERLREHRRFAQSIGAGLKLDGVERYAALVKEYVGELEAHAAEVRAVIEAVPNEREKAVLILRYCEGLTWERIADTMCYCTVNLHRIHRHALESVKSILDRMEPPPFESKEGADK